jgi:hypothetical protein
MRSWQKGILSHGSSEEVPDEVMARAVRIALEGERPIARIAHDFGMHPETRKVEETLLPTLSELPGFNGYSLIDTGNGVTTSVGFFDTQAQADESTRVAGSWLREQKLETALPNPPKITSGNVVVHKPRELVQA